MKTIFSSLVVLMILNGFLKAEEVPAVVPMGFVHVVNAVAAGSGPVSVKFDGVDMRPKGYNLGDVTGGIGLKLGSRKVIFTRLGVDEGNTTVSLDKDQTVTLIAFAEKVPATDQRPAHDEIRILRLKQKQVDSGRLATFVSVSASPELKVELLDDEGKSTAVFVKRLMVADTPLESLQSFVPVKVDGNKLNPIPIGGNGNYVVVLYDDPTGQVQSVYFRDYKYLSAD
jgi:hypothetical protein